MISKQCARCGKRIRIGAGCGCVTSKRHAPTGSDQYSDAVKVFYHTKEWERARDACIHQCHGLDLYSLFVLRKIEYGHTVHHIIPLIDNYALRISQSNLIYLTESNHRILHKLYETDYAGTTALLQSLKIRFAEFLEG